MDASQGAPWFPQELRLVSMKHWKCAMAINHDGSVKA
jgi:hypothetical protein